MRASREAPCVGMRLALSRVDGATPRDQRHLQNLYALEPHQEKAIDEEIESALNRETSEDDTHPSPLERFRLVSRVVSSNQSARSGPVWELFADRDTITQEMSSQIEKMAHSEAA